MTKSPDEPQPPDSLTTPWQIVAAYFYGLPPETTYKQQKDFKRFYSIYCAAYREWRVEFPALRSLTVPVLEEAFNKQKGKWF